MALTGNYVVSGPYHAILPPGCDGSAFTPPAAQNWSVDVPAAYVRVEGVDGRDIVTATLAIYTDSTKATIATWSSFQFQADMNGPNFVKQAYEAMKKVAPYSSMADVLEPGQTA